MGFSPIYVYILQLELTVREVYVGIVVFPTIIPQLLTYNQPTPARIRLFRSVLNIREPESSMGLYSLLNPDH